MKKTLIGVVVVLAIAAAVALRITSQGRAVPAKGIRQIQAERGIPVDAVTIGRDTLVVSRAMSGEVRGWRQTNLTAPLARKVARVFVREGQRVSRSQPILRFDTRTSPNTMTRLAQLEEIHANAKRQVARLEPLFAQGAISESDLDAARTQLAVAEANLRDARLQVEIVSPIDGVVTLLAVSPGDAVDAGDVVAQVAALDTVRVVAHVSAETARMLRPGARAWAVTEGVTSSEATAAGSGLARGRIARVALGADPHTRLYEVEAWLDNPGGRLRSGEFVTLSGVTRIEPAALVVPRTALVGGKEEIVAGGTNSVFRVRDGKAQKVLVRLGSVTEDRAEITEGLDVGDVVVVFGANRLQEGSRVRFHKLDGAPVPGGKAGGAASSTSRAAAAAPAEVGR